jgi:hypothetical protein
MNRSSGPPWQRQIHPLAAAIRTKRGLTISISGIILSLKASERHAGGLRSRNSLSLLDQNRSFIDPQIAVAHVLPEHPGP